MTSEAVGEFFYLYIVRQGPGEQLILFIKKKNLLKNILVNNIISLFRVDFKLTQRKNGFIYLHFRG